MRKQAHYYCQIIPKSCNSNGIIPEKRTITIQTNNRFSAARAAWLYLGNSFFATIIVCNTHGKIIYKTDFEAQIV
jgi:hypothetical protein